MTTYTQARDILVTEIGTAFALAFPTTTLLYENTTAVDLDTIGDRFVRVEVNFVDAMQSDIDLPGPGQVIFGEIDVLVFVREGKGLRSALELLDYFNGLMATRNLTNVYVDVPRQGTKVIKSGWLSVSLEIPFQFYTKW